MSKLEHIKTQQVKDETKEIRERLEVKSVRCKKGRTGFALGCDRRGGDISCHRITDSPTPMQEPRAMTKAKQGQSQSRGTRNKPPARFKSWEAIVCDMEQGYRGYKYGIGDAA